jgi:hypothetical protein
MDNVEKKTVSGSFYKDKNNNLYQIICEAYDVENKERKVIYQALFGDFAIYSLDRKIFTDKSEEVYGFERVEKGDNSFTAAKAKTEYDSDKSGVGKEDVTSSKQYNISNVLELFLDSRSYYEKRKILSDNKDIISQSDLDSMYAVLEIASFEGETKYQIEKLIRYLGMQEHYEGSRLRR